MRKLASVKRISSIEPIDGADAIEVATIDGGWCVVVKKNEYYRDDLVVYCEIDSFIPNAIAPFLTKSNSDPKTYEGVVGERLRTVRLRGQLSQGLILPLSILRSIVFEGDDVTEQLGIVKWEPQIPACLSGDAKGPFPSRIMKTDQERIQNLNAEFNSGKLQEFTYEVQEKCEGSSATFYMMDSVFGVCSRNLDLKETEDNSFWAIARSLEIEEKLRSNGLDNIALQGELIGPGIQGNIYKLDKLQFRLFDVQNLNTQMYSSPTIRRQVVAVLELKEAPLLNDYFDVGTMTIQQLIEMADGKSMINPSVNREGLVFKANSDFRFSFKAISNSYLLKQK